MRLFSLEVCSFLLNCANSADTDISARVTMAQR